MSPADTEREPADLRGHYKLAGALMFVWALKWFSGSAVFLLQGDQTGRMAAASSFGFAAVHFRHGANLAGLAVAVATILVGIRLRRLLPRAPEQARHVLLAIIGYEALLVMGPALLELVMVRGNPIATMHAGPIALLVCGATLPDILCAATLIWFLGAAARPESGDREEATRSPVPLVTTLAILVLLARDGLRVVLAPADVYALFATLSAGFDASVYAFVISIGVMTSLGSLVLGLARFTGGRSLEIPTLALLTLMLLRLLISFGLPSTAGFPPGVVGVAMMGGLALSSVANLAEYGMLLFAVDAAMRRRDS